MQLFFNVRYGRNWIYISLRFLMIAAFSAILYILQSGNAASLNAMPYITMPAIVGLGGIIAVGIMALIPALRVYAPAAIMPSDWALIAAYVYYAPPEQNPLLIALFVGTILMSGVLRLGSALGMIEIIGCLIAASAALSFSENAGLDALLANPMDYAPSALIVLLMAMLATVWYNTIDEENHISRKQVRKEIKESRSRLEDMRERARAFAEMAATLNSTLDYDRILDAAMDIGRLSIRHNPRERVISMALMVVNETDLEIATARGIPHIDLNQTFQGQQGLIADAIKEGYPLIIDNGEYDPELRQMRCFKNIRTTLCIPLRSNFETYGVLIFGSTAEGAINEDHTDTLAAIGTQAAIALQNAALYTDLHEEKEKLMRVEENGRKTLVRDLHDVPTQTISAVAMRLSTIPMIARNHPEQLQDEIEEIRQMATRASEELRHVMFTLRPLSLETQGLGVALEQLCEKMQKTYSQHMEADIHTAAEQLLDQDAKSALFYLIEEAANNARKYAEASLIQVKITVQNKYVRVIVRDNGKGFDMAGVSSNYEDRGSFGMVNMRERAELINADFSLDSTPGRGTQVTVRVPVRNSQYRTPGRENGHRPDTQSSRPDTAARRPRSRIPLRKKEYSGPMSPST
jgi:signal transduction histidine kinase